jgi:hypothetical protein
MSIGVGIILGEGDLFRSKVNKIYSVDNVVDSNAGVNGDNRNGSNSDDKGDDSFDSKGGDFGKHNNGDSNNSEDGDKGQHGNASDKAIYAEDSAAWTTGVYPIATTRMHTVWIF